MSKDMEKRIAIIKSRQAGWTNWLEKHKKEAQSMTPKELFEHTMMCKSSKEDDYYFGKKPKDKYKCGVCGKWCRSIENHIRTKHE